MIPSQFQPGRTVYVVDGESIVYTTIVFVRLDPRGTRTYGLAGLPGEWSHGALHKELHQARLARVTQDVPRRTDVEQEAAA